MEHNITIREAVTDEETASFWEQLHTYHQRDICPNPADNDLAYFLDDTQYRAEIQKIHDRPQDRLYYLFFYREEQNIGFAMPVIYTTEDGKCFILDFCVYPEFRGTGTGAACAKALLHWAKEKGGTYAELNYGSDDRRRRFWQRLGFVENGTDQWGEPLMLLPPETAPHCSVEILTNPDDWQLLKLENGFLSEIGETIMSESSQENLRQAIRSGKITFFLAKRSGRAVGMCSVVRYFSTFCCEESGIFDAFYVEPAFRKQGIARQLAQAAQIWSKENALASLTVCCAPCDSAMYQAFGFHIPLGSTFSKKF